MNDDKKRLLDRLNQLPEMSAEDRMDVYDKLTFVVRELTCNAADSIGQFDRSQMHITPEGHIVRRAPTVFLSHNHNDKTFV